ncbi:MAG TPA: IgGFc-binding protein [Polyangiaceae bacterium]
MHRRIVGWGVVAGLSVLTWTGGCGSSAKNGYAPGLDGGGAGGEGGGDDGGPGLVGDGSAAVPCSGNHCSSDLHSLVDCNGNVIMTCPGNEGCSGTSCVPACQSAEDNKSSLGCEYYAVDPDTGTGLTGAAGGCFAAYIANTWDTPVAVSVDYGGTTYNPAGFGYIPTGSGQNIQYAPLTGGTIPAGAVAILLLNDIPTASAGPGLKITCPSNVTSAFTTKDAATHGTAIGSAFHITVTAPVSAYDIYPYGGGQSALTSATLLLPTSAWDTNYIGVSAYGPGLVLEDLPVLTMVAEKDATQITINPTAAIMGGTGVAAGAAGMPSTYTINKGQLLQFTQSKPLDGSIIQSNNPIGVWAGKTSLAIGSCCDDSAHQQIPPVRALGSEYVGVRYRNRYSGVEESPPWRIIGAANGTVLSWDPAPPSGAPTTLALGQVTEFSASGPFVVRSQDANHPFYVSAHMTGAEQFDPGFDDGGATDMPGDGRGDAEFVNVIPPGEYLDSYVFFTDPTYPETDLVIVRTKGSNGFQDVTLDCAGTLTGWQPIGMSGYEYTRFDLVTGNFQGNGSCNNGRHEIKSTLPFGVTVWGWGSAATGLQGKGFYTQYVSYAYPAGAGVAPINTVVIPPVAQ